MLPDIRPERGFGINKKDMESIIQGFDMGHLLSFSFEKGISYSHSNRIAFLDTDKGKYILKFYLDKGTTKKGVYLEYIIANRLAELGFRTAKAFLPKDKKPLKYKKMFTLLFEYLPGAALRYKNTDEIELDKVIALIIDSREKLMRIERKYRLGKNFLNDLSYYDFASVLKDIMEVSGYEKTSLKDALIKSKKYIAGDKKIALVHRNISLGNIICSNDGYYLVDFNHAGWDHRVADFAHFITNVTVESYNRDIITAVTEKIILGGLDEKEGDVLFSIVVFGLIREYLKFKKRFETFLKGKDSKKLIGALDLPEKPELEDYLAFILENINNFKARIQ